MTSEFEPIDRNPTFYHYSTFCGFQNPLGMRIYFPCSSLKLGYCLTLQDPLSGWVKHRWCMRNNPFCRCKIWMVTSCQDCRLESIPVAFISFLNQALFQGVKDGITLQLRQLHQSYPRCRVALVTFNNTVRLKCYMESKAMHACSFIRFVFTTRCTSHSDRHSPGLGLLLDIACLEAIDFVCRSGSEHPHRIGKMALTGHCQNVATLKPKLILR